MAGQFAGSNLHVLLLHVPLVLLIVGTLIELLGFLWRRSSVRIAARWMIAIGALVAVPATTVGLYDLWRVTRGEAAPVNDQTWHETRAHSSIQEPVWEMLGRHAVTNAAATVVLLLVVVIWIGGTDTLRERLHVPMLIVVLACVVALCHENSKSTPSLHDAARAALAERGIPATQPARVRWIAPVQLHILLAGIAFAVAAASLGLSFRAASHSGAALMMTPNPGDEDYAAAFMARNLSEEELRRAAATAARRMNFRHVPAARFWMLAFLLALVTAGAGLWTLSSFSGVTSPRGIYEQVVQLDAHRRPHVTRRFAHAVTGLAIVILPLILALAARYSPRRGFIATGFGFLLAVAVAAQVWFGSLLMLDSPEGPVNRLNAVAEVPTTQHAPVRLETQEPATEPTSAPTPAPAPATAPIAGP